MPKTRNVSRAEWAAASGSHAAASRTSTTRKGKKENSRDDEKENAGRTTARTRTHRRDGLLGVTTLVMGSTPTRKAATGGKPAGKGKGKGKATSLEKKKDPLQDITSQFLPATEYANRGDSRELGEQGSIAAADTSPVRERREPIIAQPVFSPLPPSSPPSDFLSPAHPVLSRAVDHIQFSAGKDLGVDFLDPWLGLDDAEHGYSTPPSHTTSDPFGFVPVERKLKEEREVIASLVETGKAEGAVEGDDDEDLMDLPVADTSSPRPVRRLKRTHTDETFDDVENRPPPPKVDLEPIPATHLHFVTPPTPHKDKKKRRRLSHEGHDVFDPCESSVESSPSPTKTARRSDVYSQDPLEEFNEELEKSYGPDAIVDKLPGSIRTRRVSLRTDDVDPDAIARNLRPRAKPGLAASPAEEKKRTKQVRATKAKTSKKSPSKHRPKPKVDQEEDDADLEARRQQELQDRIDYFKRLDEYEVEKEDVFVV